jgi:hypothetical protein
LIIQFYLIQSRNYFPNPTPILSICNMTCYDMQMRVGPKNAGQFIRCYDGLIRVFKQCLVRKYRSSDLFKKYLYFRFGFLILKKEKQIPGNHNWECWWGSRSRSTPEAACPPQDLRLHTRGRNQPQSPWVDPSR